MIPASVLRRARRYRRQQAQEQAPSGHQLQPTVRDESRKYVNEVSLTAGLLALASEVYQGNGVALHLRAMNMLYEALKEKGSMVIVPSTAVETMGLGALSGLAALAGAEAPGARPAAASRGGGGGLRRIDCSSP